MIIYTSLLKLNINIFKHKKISELMFWRYTCFRKPNSRTKLLFICPNITTVFLRDSHLLLIVTKPWCHWHAYANQMLNTCFFLVKFPDVRSSPPWPTIGRRSLFTTMPVASPLYQSGSHNAGLLATKSWCGHWTHFH